jgi:cobalt-zinc-cadmium efflux system outer membrane protein
VAAAFQLPVESTPQVTGEVVLQALPFTLDQLLDKAQTQPRLNALSAQTESAAARLKLERASVYPDVTVGLNVGREGASNAREKVTTLSVSLPLPVFRRNASGIGQASSELTRLQIEQQAATRNAAAQVRTLWSKLQSVEARVRRLQDSVLPALESNQGLAGKSQRAGEIGLLEMIVVSRQTLDARRDLLDAQTEYFSTRTALEQAAGWQP